MGVILKVFDCKYDERGIYPEDYLFTGDIHKCSIISKTNHRSYVEMANWLDKHKKYKNRVMYIRSRKQKLSSKVIFDGVFVWVEKRGYI